MMMIPPKNSAKANFQPISVQKSIKIARFMLVDEIRNAKTARTSAPFWKKPRAAAAAPYEHAEATIPKTVPLTIPRTFGPR